MEKINRFIIFTEGGDNIGFGHITRCSALYEELVGRDIETIFVVYGNNIDEILEGKEYINIDWKNIEFLKDFLKSKVDFQNLKRKKNFVAYIYQKIIKKILKSKDIKLKFQYCLG